MHDDGPRLSGMMLAGGAVAVALIAGAAGWAGARYGSQGAMEEVVRSYILDHPEIIPEAMENLQNREAGKALAEVRGDVERVFPGAVMGNPDGKLVMVEFTDFACGYCRKAVEDVDALIAANPDLKVVIRELPIISPQSAEAARMGLAAAAQGKYPAFHRAMFAAGQPSPEAIESAARAAGLDMAQARAFAESPQVEMELSRNIQIAQQLGFSGTPSWVIGDRMIAGAVGADALAEAIEDARS
ncbi:MAG: DsbA family protein [Sphingomonadaceae bacterium]|jgi:protein-disulfide isomerase